MNIAIVGAGVIGRLVALSLIGSGHKIAIFDKQSITNLDNAAHVSAGMLCPLGEIIHAPKQVLEMGLWSLKKWPSILAKLQRKDPKNEPIFFSQLGSIAVSFSQDISSFKQLQQDYQHIEQKAAEQVKHLQAKKLHELEPALSQFQQALFLRSEGQLCNRSFLRSSTRALQQSAQIFDSFTVNAADLSGLTSDYDWVVDCRGAGAIQDQSMASEKQTLRGVRGEVVRVSCPDLDLKRPIRIVHPRTSIYIVPKPNHEFVIGATEIESHSDQPISLRSTLELLSTAYAVHPAFGEACIIETAVGIRAAYDDHIPKIHINNNCITANGLYRHGWLVGPAIAQQVIDEIQRGLP